MKGNPDRLRRVGFRGWICGHGDETSAVEFQALVCVHMRVSDR
jgi:hypothetical protein